MINKLEQVARTTTDDPNEPGRVSMATANQVEIPPEGSSGPIEPEVRNPVSKYIGSYLTV